MAYNLTGLDNVNSFYSLTKEVNTITGDILGLAIVSLIMIVSFFYMKKYDTESSLIASSFITAIISGILFFVELISFTVMIFPFLMLCIAIFIKVFTE